ncbi:hypothetical protein LN996_18075 [Arthrobacter sp. AK01]|uniref:hypothetical protein n=1 Tax=Micrococcaceae TaxID=1268 RepID=UPI001E414838|nr:MULTISPECIES: hypothetical protein [Micrococcaceae]MCD4852728.1 hypothetical protein [Arthrobacter sp. AK01]MCP1412759.1 spore coat protein U-like protein [Paenarthrobacter sp. A20]
MPYQGDTTQASTPAASAPATGTPAKTAARTVTVIPAVDLFLGTVTIISNAGTARFGHPEPHLITRALTQAVRPTQWCAASRTLTVTVAAAGKREGVQRHFPLCPWEQA